MGQACVVEPWLVRADGVEDNRLVADHAADHPVLRRAPVEVDGAALAVRQGLDGLLGDLPGPETAVFGC